MEVEGRVKQGRENRGFRQSFFEVPVARGTADLAQHSPPHSLSWVCPLLLMMEFFTFGERLHSLLRKNQRPQRSFWKERCSTGEGGIIKTPIFTSTAPTAPSPQLPRPQACKVHLCLSAYRGEGNKRVEP